MGSIQEGWGNCWGGAAGGIFGIISLEAVFIATRQRKKKPLSHNTGLAGLSAGVMK